MSGANSLFHSAPGAGRAASASVRISAAATGVPKSAPTVPAAASAAQRSASVPRIALPPSQAASAMFAAVMGFSGPRLTPPASPRIAASSRLGTTLAGSGGSTSPIVAGSGPACPYTFHTTSPTARPVAVSTVITQRTE